MLTYLCQIVLRCSSSLYSFFVDALRKRDEDMKLKSLPCSSLLSDSDIVKLNNVNVQTVEQLATYADLSALSRLTQIPEATLRQTRKYILGQYAPFPLQGEQLFADYYKHKLVIPFGCKQLDDLVSGGVYNSEITEITGASASGKTQLCINLVANMYKSTTSLNHVALRCLYVDSSGNFCVRRLVELLGNHQSHLDKILKSIQVMECSNLFHLLDILFNIKKNAVAGSDAIQSPNLLIIDSLTSLLYLFRSSRESEIYLNYLLNHIRYLANNMNMAILVVTNRNSYDQSTNPMNSMLNNNQKWLGISSLRVKLENVVLDTESNKSRPFHPDLVDESSSSPTRIRKFQVLSINRPFLKESNNRIAYFGINQSGIV